MGIVSELGGAVLGFRDKRDGFMTKPTKDEIRTSTDADFNAIADWLRDEDRQGVPGSFYCNLDAIESSHRKGRLLVYVDGTTGSLVAFQLGGLIYPGILEVKHDMRGRGIGRKLVEHCVEMARTRNECLLMIECTPDTSIPFWKKMGFKLLDPKAERRLAYRIVEKRHRLPADGTPAKVRIGFYRDNRPFSTRRRALEESQPSAVQTPDGIVHLERQVQFFPEIHHDARDAVVRIEVNGKPLCYERAKYQVPRQLGVQRCANGYFIDRINITAGP